MSLRYIDNTGTEQFIAGAGTSGVSGGSILHVHTSDFANMNLTVTDSDPDTGEIETLTGTFDNTGLATFHVTGTGIAKVSVTDTDGTVYESTVSMTYYGIYTVSVNRFSATITVTVESGAIATATDGTNTYSATSNGTATISVGNASTFTVSATKDSVTSDDKKTVTISASGDSKTASISFATITLSFTGSLVASVTKGTFSKSVSDSSGSVKVYVPSTGEYTITGTIDGKDATATANVTSYTNVDVTIKPGFNYADWLTEGRVTKTFTSLNDVLADEKTIRQLMTVHDSVDYLVDNLPNDEDSAKLILENDLCAKWINLRDYALDTLLANTTLKAIMDKSRVELKGQVPILTTDTNEIFSSGEYDSSSHKYFAFDNNLSDYWSSRANKNTGEYLGYNFNEPICIKLVEIYSFWDNETWEVQGSNDNFSSDIHNLGEFTTTQNVNSFGNVNENNELYKSYRVICKVAGSTYNLAIYKLQFYGPTYSSKYGYGEWALVDKTPYASSTSPTWGTITGTTANNTEETLDKVFDKTTSTNYVPQISHTATGSGYIQVQFKAKTIANKFYLVLKGCDDLDIQVKGSNDASTWTNLTNKMNLRMTDDNVGLYYDNYIDLNLADSNGYLYYRLDFAKVGGKHWARFYELDFLNWEPKGLVPVMTSDTAPYGSVLYSTTYNSSTNPYYPFNNDGDASDNTWAPSSSDTSPYIGYEFVNPSNIKKVHISCTNASGYGMESRIGSVTLKGNNGDSWVQIKTVNGPFTNNNPIDIDVSDDVFYKSYIISMTVSSGIINISKLQFYGRTLTVSVPTMTSNTEPWGTVSAYNYHSGMPEWNAFDKSSTTRWSSEGVIANWIQYDFAKSTLIKSVYLDEFTNDDGGSVKELEIQGSNNGTDFNNHVLFSKTLSNSTERLGHKVDWFNIVNAQDYKMYRLVIKSFYVSSTYPSIWELNFYGLDYSEREFETGSKIEYIYDHGIEIVPISTYQLNGTVTKESDCIKLLGANTANIDSQIATTQKITFNNDYDVLISKCGNLIYDSGNNEFIGVLILSEYWPSGVGNPADKRALVYDFKPKQSPSTIIVSISSVSGDYYIGFNTGYVSSTNYINTTLTELLLVKK